MSTDQTTTATPRQPRPFYEITPSDVSRPTIRAFGKTWLVVNFIGRILPGDVGKRVYQFRDILQVENDEQRAERLARTGHGPEMAREALVDLMRAWLTTPPERGGAAALRAGVNEWLLSDRLDLARELADAAAAHLTRPAETPAETPPAPDLQVHHFSLGNSADGPIGFCARILAHSETEAVELLRDRIRANFEEGVELKLLDDQSQPVPAITYVCLYFNPDAITTTDIDEITDPDPEDRRTMADAAGE